MVGPIMKARVVTARRCDSAVVRLASSGSRVTVIAREMVIVCFTRPTMTRLIIRALISELCG